MINFKIFNKQNDIKISLDSELCLREGQIYGTQIPTGHKLLINARIDISASGESSYQAIKNNHSTLKY